MSSSTTARTAAAADAESSIKPYDLVGIGIGPFNLGLAALSQPLVDGGALRAAFFDSRAEFCWHPGMMIPGTTIQVPFMADLVTLADPTSPYSFLNYCKQQGRIHQFYIKEDFNPLREEYSDYCTWVSQQLSTLEWNSMVTSVRRVDDLWEVTVNGPRDTCTVLSRNVVVGVGTIPFIPAELRAAPEAGLAVHSADYLEHKEELLAQESVTIIGSGQSAAEIYANLMEPAAYQGTRLDWVTRSGRFFPMEYTKLTLEMTSPEYAQFFRGLDAATRDRLNREQRNLYKGISGQLVNHIYDTYYRLSITKGLPRPFASTLLAGWSAALCDADASAPFQLTLTHGETGETRTHATNALVLATGYKAPLFPSFLETAREEVQFDTAGRLAIDPEFAIDAAQSLFVQNAEEHLHSLIAPDLGMGPWRNSIILKAITGREYYPIERSVAFQTFGGQ